MNRIVELGQLLDYYGAFLTERQSTLLRQYAFEDCSLSEIAEREGISRQAVRDAIARGEAELRTMEERLRLIARTERTKKLLSRARGMELTAELTAVVSELSRLWEGNDGV